MPAVVRVRRADHNLEIRVEFPEFYDRFEAIHPGRHAHIDECHCVGLAFIERGSYQRDAFLALICGLHREPQCLSASRGSRWSPHIKARKASRWNEPRSIKA